MRYKRGDAVQTRAREKAHPVLFNTTHSDPGRSVNCPQSEEGREQGESNTYYIPAFGGYITLYLHWSQTYIFINTGTKSS